MRILIQRSKASEVKVDGKVVGSIPYGMVVLVGFKAGDNEKVIDSLIDKMVNLRIFDDENKVMNKSLLEIGGHILSISQFTLYADTKKGRRPSYKMALNSTEASKLYDLFNEKIILRGINLSKGIFGADMEVKISNDGPVTIMLESEE